MSNAPRSVFRSPVVYSDGANKPSDSPRDGLDEIYGYALAARVREVDRRAREVEYLCQVDRLAGCFNDLPAHRQQWVQRDLESVARERGVPQAAAFAASRVDWLRRVSPPAPPPPVYTNRFKAGPLEAEASGPDPFAVFVSVVGTFAVGAAVVVAARHADRVLAASVTEGT